MEWKEHVAWIAPVLAPALAYVVLRYGLSLSQHGQPRRASMVYFAIAFLAAAIGGVGASRSRCARSPPG